MTFCKFYHFIFIRKLALSLYLHINERFKILFPTNEKNSFITFGFSFHFFYCFHFKFNQTMLKFVMIERKFAWKNTDNSKRIVESLLILLFQHCRKWAEWNLRTPQISKIPCFSIRMNDDPMTLMKFCCTDLIEFI